MAYKKWRKIKPIMIGLKNGQSMWSVCKAANLDPATFWKWRKRNPRLDNLVDLVRESRTQMVEDALFKSAIDGNVAAQQFWLKNRAASKWRDTQDFKHSGEIAGNQPLMIITTQDYEENQAPQISKPSDPE